jgi:hypothetical protein
MGKEKDVGGFGKPTGNAGSMSKKGVESNDVPGDGLSAKGK